MAFHFPGNLSGKGTEAQQRYVVAPLFISVHEARTAQAMDILWIADHIFKKNTPARCHEPNNF